MNDESAKRRLIRESRQNQHPDQAAAQAARRFESEAIPVPAELVPDESMLPWKARIVTDAASLYRDVVMAGPDGLKLAALPGGERWQSAAKLLRASGTVAESSERLPDRAGRMREQVVLHPTEG